MPFSNVNIVNIKKHRRLALSTSNTRIFCMVRSAHPRAPKKTAKPYHHRDLRRALPDAALRTIQTHGVKHLTLRTVGTEGFRKLRQTLADAWLLMDSCPRRIKEGTRAVFR